MIFHNGADYAVLITVNGMQLTLQPNERAEISVAMPVQVNLKHFYGSTSMSKQQIKNDVADVSMISALLSSYQPPYFTIVLNSTYLLQGDPNAEVKILREVIRPCYHCSYDRFYLVSDSAFVTAEYYDFLEKEQFTALYKDASMGSIKKIVAILIAVECFFGLLMILGMFNYNALVGMLGIIGLLIECGGTILIAYIYYRVTKYIDVKTVLEEFESKKIEGYFKKK